jgi:four helix bundle protein
MAGVRRYQELEAWQIADELKREVYALIATGPVSKDFDFCNQIRASAASATKNIAEGFGRFRPADNARFVEFALSSTMETQDSLKDGVDRGHFTPERALRAQQLAERSIQCSTKFIVYLKSCNRKHRPRSSND